MMENLFKKTQGTSFFQFMESVMVQLHKTGKTGCYNNYYSAFISFAKFCRRTDVQCSELTPGLIMAYENWLNEHQICPNTASFYMRILRAVYNRAVLKGYVTEDTQPFKQVYTGVAKTCKRALSAEDLKRIFTVDLSQRLAVAMARDVFLFSFYTRGMSFVDIAYLKKSDIRNGMLSYTRKKTHQSLHIKWEPYMQEIADRYSNPDSPYLFNFIRDAEDDYLQYRNALRRVNANLKTLARLAGVETTLSSYCARHSWATFARDQNVDISVISEALGHNSILTTQIYLDSVDNSKIDQANAMLIKLLRE